MRWRKTTKAAPVREIESVQDIKDAMATHIEMAESLGLAPSEAADKLWADVLAPIFDPRGPR